MAENSERRRLAQKERARNRRAKENVEQCERRLAAERERNRRICRARMKRDSDVDVTSIILDQRNELLTICEKVQRLESFVSTVRQTVDKMEKLVTNAELDLKNTTEGKIRSMLKPFFRRSDSDEGGGSRNSFVFTPPQIFNTSQLIKNSRLETNQHAQSDVQ